MRWRGRHEKSSDCSIGPMVVASLYLVCGPRVLSHWHCSDLDILLWMRGQALSMAWKNWVMLQAKTSSMSYSAQGDMV